MPQFKRQIEPRVHRHTRVTQIRKLAAILSADVFGYSRLMSEDEQGTVAALHESKEIMARHITAQGGRLVDAIGDAVMAEFPSARAAINAAVEIQRELFERNRDRPESRRMQWRVGVNLGDVIEENGALYGDGINIAARLQTLANPGGVCISGTVFEQVEGKQRVPFTFAGEQVVKNIAKPVRTFHAVLDWMPQPAPVCTRPLRRNGIFAGVVLVSVVAGFVAWHQIRSPTPPSTTLKTDQASHDQVLAMPTGPRVAVLPFANMSNNPKEEYFADGLTQDIITELSRFRELYVLARNTTYQFKGQAVDVPATGRKLGVQYLLEGSVRRSGSQVRITAQLIDVQTGAHIWADRYDRNLRDIFLVQEEIAHRIAGSIAGGRASALQTVARETVGRKSEDQLKAYDYVLRVTLLQEWWNPTTYPKAKADLQKAIALDPSYARARQTYAWITLIGWIFRYEKTDAPPREIKENAIRSVELDPSNPHAHLAAAFGYYFDKQFEQFEREANSAVELAPNDPEILSPLGFLIAIHGRWERGVRMATKAHELNAKSAAGWYPSTLFYDLYRRGMYRQAIDVLNLHQNPGVVENLQKYTAAYAELGELEHAREFWAKCRQVDPDWSADKLNGLGKLWAFDEIFWARYMKSIAKAGYPVTK